MSKPQVVYLFGAGASQGKVNAYDNTINILMRNITEGVSTKIRKNIIKGLDDIRNELIDDNADIEQLITLYESTGITKYLKIAKLLRKAFIKEIQEQLRKLPENYVPNLFCALLDMYNVKGNDEEITGILTLNYDELVEIAATYVNNETNYSLLVNSLHTKIKINSKCPIPIIKLHGSFNWKNEFPIKVLNEVKIKSYNDLLWIPPGVIKNRENYPFNILWGKARELLDCDILRIIGCSLSRNDWVLVSLLQFTQKFNSNRNPYSVEIIDYENIGKRKKEEYPYLKIKSILDIEEFRKYLGSDFSLTFANKEGRSKSLEDFVSTSNSKLNIFELWLRWRGDFLKNKGIDIDTNKKYFKNFIENNKNENSL